MFHLLPTLRSRLLVLVCLAALPGALLTVLTALQERGDGVERVREEVHRLADLAAGEEQHRLTDVARQLTNLTFWPAIRARDTEACVARLATLLGANPDYSWFTVADRTGHSFCASEAAPPGETVAGHAAFQRAVASRAFAIGDAVSQDGRAAVIEFSLPHTDQNRTIDFVVTAALQARSLSIFAARARLPAQAALLLLDGTGRVLLRAASAPEPEGTVLTTTGIRETIPVRGAAAERVHDPDGVTRFYAFSPLQEDAAPPMDMQLGVGFPRDLAFARADADLRRNLLLLSTLTLLALLIAWVGSERVVLRPLSALAGAAQRLAAGDLGARTGLAPARDEVGRLAATFDQMAQVLAAQTTQLAQREERFRALVERGFDLILLVDGNGIVQTAAPSSRRLLDRAPEELVGRGLVAYVHPAEAPHVLATLAAVQRDPSHTALVAARYRHANGAWRWLEGAVKNLLAEPAVAAIVLNLRDVTARRQAEAESRELAARLQLLLDSAGDGIFGVDGAGRCVFMNPAALAMFACTAADVLGKRLHPLVHHSFADGTPYPWEACPVRKVLHTGTAYRVEDEVFWRSGGTAFPAQYTVYPTFAAGAVIGAVIVCRDITEQRAAAARTQRAHERLVALHGLTADLSHALELPDVIRVMREHLGTRLGVPVAAVYLYDAGSDHLVLTEGWNLADAAPAACARIPAWDYASVCRIPEAASLPKDQVREAPRDPHAESVPAPHRHVSLPLVSGETLQGALDLWLPNDVATDDVPLAYFQAVAQQLSVAIEQARLFAAVKDARTELEAISRRLVDVQERERRWIAQELHDEVGQMLTALHFMLESLWLNAAPDRASQLVEAQRLTQELIRKVRHLSLDLRPSLLDDLGLVPALAYHVERYAEHTGIAVTFEHWQADQRFAPPLETAAFRIVQEALTNVARHSRAERAIVRLWCDPTALHLQVEDEGVGFAAEAVGHRSAGLSGMRERAFLVDGDLVIEAVPGRGTRISAELPVSPLAQEDTAAP